MDMTLVTAFLSVPETQFHCAHATWLPQRLSFQDLDLFQAG